MKDLLYYNKRTGKGINAKYILTTDKMNSTVNTSKRPLERGKTATVWVRRRLMRTKRR